MEDKEQKTVDDFVPPVRYYKGQKKTDLSSAPWSGSRFEAEYGEQEKLSEYTGGFQRSMDATVNNWFKIINNSSGIVKSFFSQYFERLLIDLIGSDNHFTTRLGPSEMAYNLRMPVSTPTIFIYHRFINFSARLPGKAHHPNFWREWVDDWQPGEPNGTDDDEHGDLSPSRDRAKGAAQGATGPHQHLLQQGRRHQGLNHVHQIILSKAGRDQAKTVLSR